MEIVKILVENGADTKAKNKENLTPLDLADKFGTYFVAVFLKTFDSKQSFYWNIMNQHKLCLLILSPQVTLISKICCRLLTPNREKLHIKTNTEVIQMTRCNCSILCIFIFILYFHSPVKKRDTIFCCENIFIFIGN